VLRYRAGSTVSGEDVEQAVAREVASVLVADAHEAGPVERRQSASLPERRVERGDIGEPDQRLGVGGDQVELEVGEELCRAEPSLHAVDDVDLWILERGIEVASAGLRIAGDVVVTVEDPLHELDAVALGLPPLLTSENLGAVEVR